MCTHTHNLNSIEAIKLNLQLFLMFLKQFLYNFCSVILLHEATDVREQRCLGGVYLVCNCV